MIDLSKNAAKRFRVKWSDLESRSCDCWKVDVVMFERVPMLFIVHEHTLFTLVRRKSIFRHPLDIVEEITISCPWYRNTMEPTLGKNDSRKIIGSINEMKRVTWGLYSPEQINSIEMSINQTLFSYLSHGKGNYGNSFEAVENYAIGKTPWL